MCAVDTEGPLLGDTYRNTGEIPKVIHTQGAELQVNAKKLETTSWKASMHS